jgi:hypothetical protein
LVAESKYVNIACLSNFVKWSNFTASKVERVRNVKKDGKTTFGGIAVLFRWRIEVLILTFVGLNFLISAKLFRLLNSSRRPMNRFTSPVLALVAPRARFFAPFSFAANFLFSNCLSMICRH